MMFGYATNATASLMPAPIHDSHKLLERLQYFRKQGNIDYLRPDAKTQVSVLHKNGKLKAITNIVISHQTADVPLERIRKDMIDVTRELLERWTRLKSRVSWKMGASSISGLPPS